MTGLPVSTPEAAPRHPAVGAASTQVLPTQRATAPATERGGTGTPPAAGNVLLADTDQAALTALGDELTAVGVGPVMVTTDVDDLEEATPRPGGLAVVSLRFGSRAVGVIKALRAAGWRRILALTTTADPGPALDAVAAGATGIVVARRASPATQQLPAGIFDLSAREVEVIRMVADGRPNKWIGEQLDLSALTVKSHLARIGRKLGTGDRAHIVALALRAGVIV